MIVKLNNIMRVRRRRQQIRQSHQPANRRLISCEFMNANFNSCSFLICNSVVRSVTLLSNDTFSLVISAFVDGGMYLVTLQIKFTLPRKDDSAFCLIKICVRLPQTSQPLLETLN